MRLVTLNIRHGGGSRVPSLLLFLAELDADALLITEYREGARGHELCAGLFALGYIHHAQSCVSLKQNAVLLVARQPFKVVNRAAGPHGHEHRLLVVDIADIRLIGAYFPQGEVKRVVFDHVRTRLLPGLPELGILLGDLNTGEHFTDEAGKTFACADAFSALQGAGLVDAWRHRNPTASEYTWFSTRGNGFRIDHALCTPLLNARVHTVKYVHSPRLAGITDHSALVLGGA